MSILINMEMLKSCPCSLLGVGYDLYCFAVNGIPKRYQEYNLCCENGTRPDWCPLVEVPTPHGRLIDAGDFFSQCPELTAYEQVAKVVIEAEGET